MSLSRNGVVCLDFLEVKAVITERITVILYVKVDFTSYWLSLHDTKPSNQCIQRPSQLSHV